MLGSSAPSRQVADRRFVELNELLYGNRLFIKLLHLDQPAPERSDAEVDEEIERNYRWNYTANLLDGVLFWFGLAFVSSTTIVPLFISKITLNPVIIGFVAMIAQASWYLPQMFTAGAIERLDRKKPVVVNIGFILERLPVWLWPLAALAAYQWPVLSLSLFILGYAWHGLGAGMIGPAWQELFAKCIPVKKRGGMFGFTTFLGTGVGVFGAALSSWFLRTLAYPLDFVAIFTVAALSITVSWVFLTIVREPVKRIVPERDADVRIWPRTRTILQNDVNFRNYLTARMLVVLGGMGIGFITVAAVQEWGVSDSTVGLYTAILLTGQTVGSLASGLISDRVGHKVPLLLGALTQAVAFTIAAFTPVAAGFFVVFALIGVTIGINLVSGLLIAMEFSVPQRRPTYVGIANTSVGVASGIAPLLGGWLAVLGYDILFLLSAVIGVIAVVSLYWKVRDPRGYNRVHSPAVDPT